MTLICTRCKKRTSESNCNNLQCPHCGGNMTDYEPEPDGDQPRGGRELRNTRQRESRKARHTAMIACGLVRCRVNGRVFYE